MYTQIEDYIYKMYKSIGINCPTELDMLSIAKKLGVEIIYKKTVFSFNNEIVLIKGTPRQEWVYFGHEICHYLRHSGSQLNMHPLFIELQEWQADNFMYHFCVPTFMLQRIRLPPDRNAATYLIVETFNVDYAFAEERLERYQRKLYTQGFKVPEKQTDSY